MSTLNSNPIAKAVRTALIAGTAAAMAIPSVYAAEEGAKDEKVVITGSRIKRAEVETATPVITITSEDIENQGRLTVADALRNATFNSFGSFNEQSGSSAQSQATVSLMGAGSDRTLILMDGKRLPGSPSLGGTAVNLNNIPMAMVERIEVMKDAGSAVYGSDAIAGVINIITKSGYDGLNISGGIGRPSKEGADSENFSITGGVSGPKGNFTFAFDHQVVDAIFDKDRDYTAASWEDTNNDGVIQLAFETQGVSIYGATVFNPDNGLIEASPLCDDLTANVPGFVGEVGLDVYWPGAGYTGCGYAYANISANKASINRNSIYMKGDYEISSDVTFFSRLMMSHNRSFGRYAPPAAPFPFIPAGNPHNPSTTQDTWGYFRWYQLGPRDNNIDDYTQDYIAGFSGYFGESAEWELYYHYNHQDNKSVGNTYLSFSGLYTNLYLGEAFDTEAGLGALGATTLNEDRNIFSQIYGGVGFQTGDASHYVGFETFDIRYKALVDKQSEAGWVGGSAGNSAARDRDVVAAFYEFNYPIMDNLEVNFAVRYDDYSDFGTETSPKLSLRYQATDDLMVRFSLGEGFRAPTLQELSAADAFSAEFAIDYIACANATPAIAPSDCPENQYDTTVQSNDQLTAETSDFMNIGAIYSGVENLTLRVDYSQLDIDNVVGYLSVQQLIYLEMIGQASPDPRARIDRINGGIDEAFTISLNGAARTIHNLDIEADYKWETEFGTFDFGLDISRILKYEDDIVFGGVSQDIAGFSGAPEVRAQLTTVYSNGDHAFAWNIDYIDNTADAESPVINGSDISLQGFGIVETVMIHNMSYSYDAGNWGRYTVGLRNAFEDDLPTNSGDASVYNSNLYTPLHLGRTAYVNFSLDF